MQIYTYPENNSAKLYGWLRAEICKTLAELTRVEGVIL